VVEETTPQHMLECIRVAAETVW